MKKIVGIDEVGKGPLAGPVTICIISCSSKIYSKLKKNKNLPPLGKDSKKLKVIEREKYSEILKTIIQNLPLDMDFSIINVSNKIIDKKGISFSIKKAISQGIQKLKLNPINCEVLLDGSLKAPKEFIKQKTIIKGDEKEKIIAWASILAKVSRDGLMIKIGKKYPQYGFKNHKGYGTLSHRQAIKKYGLSEIHRMSFCKKY